nr:MAG TPA: hypothetical protein [Caudoviricetes sp.]
MSDATTCYREMRGDLERFAKELDELGREAEEVANDLARDRRNRDLAAGVAAAYYAASSDASLILSRFPEDSGE